MSVKDDVLDMKKEVNDIKEHSLAMELVKDYKKKCNMFFWMWFITFIGLLLCGGYLVYTLNDVGTTKSTIDVDDIEKIDNSTIKIGDDVWGKLE